MTSGASEGLRNGGSGGRQDPGQGEGGVEGCSSKLRPCDWCAPIRCIHATFMNQKLEMLGVGRGSPFWGGWGHSFLYFPEAAVGGLILGAVTRAQW